MIKTIHNLIQTIQNLTFPQLALHGITFGVPLLGLSSICLHWMHLLRQTTFSSPALPEASDEEAVKISKRILVLQFNDFENQHECIDLINQTDPDVVCLASLSKVQALAILEELEDPLPYMFFSELPTQGAFEEEDTLFLGGNAILSRFPLKRPRKFSLASNHLHVARTEKEQYMTGPDCYFEIDDGINPFYLVYMSPDLANVPNYSWEQWGKLITSNLMTEVTPNPQTGLAEAQVRPFVLAFSFVVYLKEKTDSVPQFFKGTSCIDHLVQRDHFQQLDTSESAKQFHKNIALLGPSFENDRCFDVRWVNSKLRFSAPHMMDLLY